MFTGLVAGLGTVTSARQTGGEVELSVDLAQCAQGAEIGDSIALSGVCCTITSLEGAVATFRLTEETLRRTWLGAVQAGDILNIESALRAGDPLGGHMVQGHVDGLCSVVSGIDPQAGGEMWIEIPPDLIRYCVEKGSVTLDGISLTIAALEGPKIMLAIIPHTAQVTTLGSKRAGQSMHVEVDVLAKYVERLLDAREAR